MEKIIVNGGNNRLVGTVKIEGAKTLSFRFLLQQSLQVRA